MYTAFYDLAEPPFQNTTDQRFLWLGEKHKEALAALQYGIMEDKGFVLLTGDVGTGKTALINALLNEIENNALVASLSDPGVDRTGFLKLVSRAFQIPGEWESLDEFFVSFENFLRNAHRDQKQVLLVVDEAQKLSDEVLEQVRVLSNIELPESKLINIVLVGQDELYENLQGHGCRALRQRINIHHRLNTLSENETVQYVQHRLKVAGLEKKLFDWKALRLVHRFSKGYPRLVNRICDHALLTGFVREEPVITSRIVKECSSEILFPSETAKDRLIFRLLRNAKRFFPGEKRFDKNPALSVDSNTEKGTVFSDADFSETIRMKESDFQFEVQKESEKNGSPDEYDKNDGYDRYANCGTVEKNVSGPVRSPLFSSSGNWISWVASAAVLLAVLGSSAGLFSRGGLFEKREERRQWRSVTDMSDDTVPKEQSSGKKKSETARVEKEPSLQKNLVYLSGPKDDEAIGENSPRGGKQPSVALEKPRMREEESEPASARSWAELGKERIRAKDFGSAVDAYEKAAKLDPNSSDVFFNLGYLKAQLKDYGGAEEMFRRATQLSPAYLDHALFNLAMVQLKQGKKQDSLQNLERALKLNPDNRKARRYFQQLNDSRGGLQ